MRNGLTEFEEACRTLNVDLIPLIVRTTQWVDPRTYDELPVWYPEIARKQPLYKAGWVTCSENKGETKSEANIKAGQAFWQALGISSSKHHQGEKVENWTVCHIWGVDDPQFQKPNDIVQNPMYYSNIGNMVLLPTPLKAFTDCLPEIKLILRICSWNLYGFACDECAEDAVKVKSGAIPEFYPSEWPRTHREKLPPNTFSYNSKIAGFSQKRKAQIRADLHNEQLNGTHYPREQVLEVLKAFPGNEPEWWL